MKTLFNNIKVPKLKDSLIKDSKLFTWIDPDFVNYGVSKKGKESKAMNLEVMEMDKDATFKELFDNPEKQALTQGQILHFIKNNKDKLRQDGYATFFLFKSGDNFFVAYVFVDSVGFYVFVYRFENDYVYYAEGRRRLVVPQLETSTLEIEPLSLGLSGALTSVGEAIELLKSVGYKVIREF